MTQHDPTPSPDPTENGGSQRAAAEDPQEYSTVDERITQLENDLQEAQDRVLRAQAEAENTRRRMRREVDDVRQYATQGLLADLLPALDNLQRALESAEASDPDSVLLQGVRMVSQHIVDVLAKHHCDRIEADGHEFDPTQHEAIGQQPNDSVPSGHVMLVAQDGFRLHDRIVRPAQVIVSSGPADS